MILSAAGARRRLDWRRAATILAVLLALTGLGMWIAELPEAPAMAQRPLARPATGPWFLGSPPADVTLRQHSAMPSPAPTWVPESAGGIPDMKQVFDAYAGSSDPRERRIAARAFDTCVPAFLPGRGESPSPEGVIGMLPAARRAEREVSYRLLYASCASFLRESRPSLMGLLEELQADPELQEPGLRAQDELIAGRYERIEPLVSEALASGDPAGVASLAGLAARLALLRNPEASDRDLMQRARAVDEALPWVACDLGLDCSANSFGALQLCAVQGLCDGDMLSRLMRQAMADEVDLAEVRVQHARLLALVRSGRALDTVDLLP
jgi:hypothetical protein